jgi:hypothetical protein
VVHDRVLLFFPDHFRQVSLYNHDRALLFFPDHFRQVSLYNHDRVLLFFPGHFRQVSLYNHDRVLLFSQATTSRNLLMKISKSRFEFAIRYIADIQNVDRQK